MTTIDNFEDIFNDYEEQDKKTATDVLIISSFDDQEKLLSCLPSTNTEVVVLNLNNKNLSNTYSIMEKNNKRSLLQLENELLNDGSKNGNIKRRKADLTCVICGGVASGYNFNQITCESCKAFFRRNALHPIEKTKCLNHSNNSNEIRCNVGYDIKPKCQRCRLLKCFELGMSKDHILTVEEKLSKQQRLEENRRIRSIKINNNDHDTASEPMEESLSRYTTWEPLISIPSSPSYLLTEADWSCLNEIQTAYFSALQSSPSAASVLTLELGPDRMSAYMNTLDIQNFAAVRIINFLRQIPDFEALDESDRLMLVKYNLTLLFVISHALKFDATREIIYDDTVSNSVSPADEAFAQQCKSLFILCYGYEFNRVFLSTLRTASDLVNNDPIIVQLLMLIMIFLKGLSANDDQEPSLNDGQRVFHIHSKYTDLLFRYLIERSSYDVAVVKMMRITELLIKSQRVIRDFHEYIKGKIDISYINPLMKSLLHLT